MPVDAETYFHRVREMMDYVVSTQRLAVAEAAGTIASIFRRGDVVHLFGTGHSNSLSRELAGRAGGLVPFNMISIKDLALRGSWARERVMDPTLEREPSVADELWKLHRIEPGDGFLISSNSGRNGAVVQMAALARSHGLPVVAITSLRHSQRVTSNHPSGKRLMELADVVIDNGAPFGDALLELPNGGSVCAASTITGALIAQMIVAEVARVFLDAGLDVPALVSVNVPGGEARNQSILARYEGRVSRGEP